MKDHVIICGFGVKGRSAVSTLLAKGIDRDQIVVIDEGSAARDRATSMGLTAVSGSAAETSVLEHAGVRDACAVVVAVNRDDTAVLATLTARELNKDATIVAAAREAENVHLLRQSGATSVITSAEASGRLLGFAVQQPRVTEVLEDLISVGEGLDVTEQTVGEDDAGPLRALDIAGPIVAVIRGEELMRFDDPRAAAVEPGDRVVFVRSNRH